jgi:hypothetical protein
MTEGTPSGDRTDGAPQAAPEILTARSGAPTLRVGGRSVHSAFDPLAEAAGLIARLPDAPGLLLFGFGLGYPAAAWRSRFPDRPILAFDHLLPDAALGTARDNVFGTNPPLLHEPDQERIRDFLHGFSPGQLTRLARLQIRGMVDLAPDFYRAADAACSRALADELADRFTELEFERLWLRNLVLNSARLSDSQPFATLTGAFTGKTALLAGAGPSLGGLRDWIKQEREKLVLFAVDTALRPLVAAGIEPDYVVSLDGQIHNLADFHGINVRRMQLLYDLTVYPAIPALPFSKRFHFETAGFSMVDGRACLISHPFVLWIKQCIGEIGALSCGGNVTTSALDAIHSCGFRELYLAGCDHAFPGGATHCRDAPLPERLALRADRLHPLEAQSRALIRRRRRVTTVSNDGRRLTGDMVLERYAAWTGEACRADGDRVHWWTLSARARKIAGIRFLSPEAASQRLAGSAPDTAPCTRNTPPNNGTDGVFRPCGSAGHETAQTPVTHEPALAGLQRLAERFDLLRNALDGFLTVAAKEPAADDPSDTAAHAAALLADFPFLKRAFRKQELFLERKNLPPAEGARFLMREMRFLFGRLRTLLDRRLVFVNPHQADGGQPATARRHGQPDFPSTS